MTFLPGQRARLRIYRLDTAEIETVLESDSVWFEAPNWSPDGDSLVVNAGGGLFVVDLTTGSIVTERPRELVAIPVAGEFEFNNDHVITPDGGAILATARDGHLYEIAVSGGSARRITGDTDPAERFKFYLHGVSPDGETISAVGGGLNGAGVWVTNVYLVSRADGSAVALTADDWPDDGPEFSSDGARVWFNSERAGQGEGHAQLFSVAIDGSDLTQHTHDARVNWFPHPSPDGSAILYLSYPAGTIGHPGNLPVELRLMDRATGVTATLVELFGGQGTTNVTGWSPDGSAFAFVDYPTE